MGELNRPPARLRKPAGPDQPPVIELCGEIDLVSVDAARAVVEGVLANRPPLVVFDLGQVSFVDSSGLALLIEAANVADKVELLRPSKLVRRLLEVTGLAETFSIEP
jgi:anti-anti-sigma factor